MYTTFKENVSNINVDSLSVTLPKVHAFIQEIAKFVQEVNIKYCILLNYTVLEVSEVPHWAETFLVLAKTNIQQEAQSALVPAPNYSVPLPQVPAQLSHQQAEIYRSTQVTQQWSVKGPHQDNQPAASYSQDRFNTSTGRGRSVRSHSTPNMSLVPNNRTSRHFDEFEQQRYDYHD